MRCTASAALALVLIAHTPSWGQRPAPPADFKVQIETFGARKDPLRRAELLVRKGRAYWLLSDSNEVVVYEPAAGQVELFDLERMQRTDLSLTKLDDALNRWRKAKLSAAEKRQQAGGRANELAASMARDLITPKFQVAFDPTANRLRLTNTSVEVDAQGEPEPDVARRAFEADALSYFLKLETIRNPTALPPFAALDALSRLTTEQTLRPQEITFLYRLSGTPHKVRWTYKLQPTLAASEQASVAKIDVARERAAVVRFDRYEEEDDGAQEPRTRHR